MDLGNNSLNCKSLYDGVVVHSKFAEPKNRRYIFPYKILFLNRSVVDPNLRI